MPSAPHLDFAGEIRAATNFPTFHAARIQDVATARHAIASGKLDMVGMTRAHMTDPHIVRKIVEKREDDIRPCVGANYCLDRIYQGGAAYCIHNAATGRETTMPHEIAKAGRRKKVVVVGAGPGGLEAARVAAERGHDVVVFEAADEPGGQVRLTSRSPRRKEMIGIIDWRMEQCRARRRPDFILAPGRRRDVVVAESPDVVIIATGGAPHTEVLKSGNELVVSSWEIISGEAKPGSNVLIFDDAGDHAALQAAEVIAGAGGKVEIMTPDRSFAPEVMGMNLVPYMRSLQKRDVTFTVTFRLESVRRDGNAAAGDGRKRLWRSRSGAARGPGRREPRHAAARRALFRAQACFNEPWRGRLWRSDRGPARSRELTTRTDDFSCSASATRWLRETRTRRSTTRSDWSRTSEPSSSGAQTRISGS